MKKFAKILFAALLVASVLGLSSCNWNTKSELAGNTYACGETGDIDFMELTFDKKSVITVVLGFGGETIYTAQGNYQDSIGLFTVSDMKLVSYFRNGVDMTEFAIADPETEVMFTMASLMPYSYTLAGDALVMDNVPCVFIGEGPFTLLKK